MGWQASGLRVSRLEMEVATELGGGRGALDGVTAAGRGEIRVGAVGVYLLFRWRFLSMGGRRKTSKSQE